MEIICRGIRREEVLLCRLRIGHSRMTHGYFLRRLDSPHCTNCNAILSIRHVLLDCPVYDHLRLRYNILNGMASVLGDNSDVLDRVLMFMRETGIISHISDDHVF